MIERSVESEIVTDATFEVPSGKPGFRRALLINPPVYDAQYWARWSQPAGLLRIATLLKSKGHHVDLIDCMETDRRGMVPKHNRIIGAKRQTVPRDDISKPIY